ncbi:hypothetical protein JW756_04590 [Candidatus Woesearchaeota archaeon]|nr:hypothetical protein [Candidatus Woesearchaeota archaeon]
MKKGQAAMEFLMTYGWAILVVLAAIGALAYFGVLSPDRFMPSKCMVTGGFSCVEYKITTTQVRFYLQNNLGNDANITSLTITPSGGASSDCTVAGAVMFLSNGQKSQAINVTNNGTATCLGSTFKADLQITYLKSGETETHIATGSISGKAE